MKFKIKYTLFFLINLLIVAALIYTLISFLTLDVLSTDYEAILSQLNQLPMGIGFIFLGCFIVIFVFLLAMEKKYLTRIFEKIKIILEEKKLLEHFSDITEFKSSKDVVNNITRVLDLNQNFEQLKNNRINQEMNTLQLLFDNMTEGVVFVSKHKIVTHINRSAEALLRLIPDEIIGQHLSRKITYPDILQSLDILLEDEKRIVKKEITIEDQPILMSILPIKDKLENILRVVLIFYQTQKTEEKQNKEKENNKNTEKKE